MMRITPEQAMARWIKAGAMLSVQWDAAMNRGEFEAVLFGKDNSTVADGNGDSVEDAIGNCAANIEELPQAQEAA